MTESFDSARLAADRNADPERKPRCSNCRHWDAIMIVVDGCELPTGTGHCRNTVSPWNGAVRGTRNWCLHHSYTPATLPAPIPGADTGGDSWQEAERETAGQAEAERLRDETMREAEIARRVAEAVEAERRRVLGITGCTRGQHPDGTQFCALLDQAVAAEREACAVVAESFRGKGSGIALAIRARGAP